MTKLFTLSVDKSSIVPEYIGRYTIALNVTDNNEDPISQIFTFTLEVVETIPEVVEEEEIEIIEEEVVEEEEEEEKTESFDPSYVPKEEVVVQFDIEKFLQEEEEKKKVKPEKKKRNAIPEPSIKIGKVTPMGTIPIEFN